MTTRSGRHAIVAGDGVGCRLAREFSLPPDVLRTFERVARLPYPLLLDSTTTSKHGAATARYSFVAAAPRIAVRAKGWEVEVHDLQEGTVVRCHGRGLDIVADLAEREARIECLPGLPPFQGGAAGYVGYEYGRVLEQLPVAADDDLAIPDLVMGIYDWVVAWDHLTERAWIIGASEAQLDSVAALIDGAPGEETHFAVGEFDTPGDTSAGAVLTSHTHDPAVVTTAQSNFTAASYAAAVERVRTAIVAGEIFQANLSQRFSVPLVGTAWALYRRLRVLAPAPFAAYFDFGCGTLVSASPERFLFVDAHGRVETRPIKGTRPRAATAAEDAAQRTALLHSEKDAAEHVMIVDVLRNDLSRVCEYGSVQVPALRTHEAYATVHHLVSTITGQLRPSATAVDLFHASFPGGSITGAPKLRAMEIIAALEPVTRGVYCGAIGYFSTTGAMDTSIAIRTCVVTNGRVYLSAGGGIVADSDPNEEYRETLVKARALLRAGGAGDAACSAMTRLPE